jgi:phosphoglycolate phosphatase
MNLIFDLDGTLTEPELGITRCFVYALERLGLPAPDRTQLRRFIGPPLRDVFGELLATSDPAVIERAVAFYRERFGDVGLYENELYPGMADSVEHLARCGHRMFVATAKAEIYARRIVEHFRLGHHFAAVYGAALSGEESHKSQLLGRLLRNEAVDPRESIMIGDRSGDITGARENGMRSIGVLWGYGTASELAEADVRVRTQAELVAAVGSMSAQQ